MNDVDRDMTMTTVIYLENTAGGYNIAVYPDQATGQLVNNRGISTRLDPHSAVRLGNAQT